MQIAIGGLWHETHTFANTRTRLEDFQRYQFASGAEVTRRYAGTRTELGGFIDGARAEALALQPLLYAGAVPSGLVEQGAYAWLRRELLRRLEAALPLDGVLLALHGAMVAEGTEDAEADLLRAVRERVGPECRLAVTLDNHANVGPACLALADLVIPYDTYPHVDMYDRGREACVLLARRLRGEIQPCVAWRKLPLLSPPQAQTTGAPPMQDLMALARDLESRPGVLTASLAFGYPYSDVERAGLTVLVYTDGDAALADACAEELAGAVWARRHEFLVTGNVAPAQAVHQAIAASAGPVVLVDVADNIGGGAPGDGTVLLRELLEQGAAGAVVTLADPEAVAQAIQSGVRSAVSFTVGGKHDDLHGAPVSVQGKVRLISAGRYVHQGTYMTGQTTDMGRTVVLDCAGVELVLSERKAMPFDAQQLRSLGIEPATRQIIVVKSAIAWKAAYGELARAVIYVDTPGLCASDLRAFDYQRVPRPIFPLDDI